MDVVIGIDINEYKAQVSYAALDGEQAGQVKTLTLTSRGDGTQVETAICKRPGVNQWFYGLDAIKKAMNGQGFLAENLWQKFCLGEEIELDGQSYEPAHLCNLFLKRILSSAVTKIREEEPEVTVRQVAIVADPFPAELYEKMPQVVQGLLPEQDDVFWQTYEEALFFYLTNQPERLLGYETGILDFSNETMIAYRVDMNPKAKPIVTMIRRAETGLVRKKHYPSIMEHDRCLIELDKELGTYVEAFVSGRIVTTFYLVGDGFEGDWCQESLKTLCRNRKVFAGNNLYSKGAAYSAMERVLPPQEEKKYIYLGRNMLAANIGVFVQGGGKEEYLPMLDAGTSWHEAVCSMTFMLDEADEIFLRITPVGGGKPYEEAISLENLDRRPACTYRIKLTLAMQSETLLRVTVEDEGFGELFAKSADKAEKLIELGGGF